MEAAKQTKKIIIVVKKPCSHLEPYFKAVRATVKTMMDEKKSDFVLQSQIGHRLKQNNVNLPVSLSEFFKVYYSVFKTSFCPETKALTVSLRPSFR